LSAVTAGEDVTRGSKWSLRHLKWDNMFTYGEGNVVDFDKLSGIVGIFGPNRTGKSSIVGTLMYSLFNTTDRGSMKNIYVCNVRKPYCSSRAIIEHDGTSYVIERQTTKSTNKKGIESASTALNLFRIREDGEADDLCGEQRNDTEKSVRSLIGTADDFLMTSLSAQGETNQFLSQGSTKRRSILSRFLDLDIFDKMYDLANKEVNSIKSQLKIFPDRDWDVLTAQNQSALLDRQKSIDDTTSKIAEAQLTVTMLREELSKHNASPVTQSDVSEQQTRVDALRRKSADCSAAEACLLSEVKALQEKLVSVNEVIQKYDIVDLKSRIESQRLLEKAVTDLQNAYDRESILFRQQQKSLKILDEVPCGDDYPSCKFIKDAHAVKVIHQTQADKVDAARKVLESTAAAFVSAKDDTIDDKLTRHEKASSLSSKIRLEISHKETDIEKARAACAVCSSSLLEAEKKLQNMETALKNEENVDVVSIKSNIAELSADIRQWDADKLQLASRLGKLMSDIDKLSTEKSDRDVLLRDVKVHELISDAFAKDGIPLLITTSQLPLINLEVSNILQGIVDFTIEMENDEETDALEIYINYGDSRRIIELCSGMEKTIAAFALRVAMINVSSLPKPNIFIIDEGFGTLDSSGVESCNRLLTSLKRYFKTLVVITHVDGIKDCADHILEISKNEKDASLEFS